MGKISWIHLSDLHLGKCSDEYNENVVLDSLYDDINRQLHTNNIKLDFIFITGDLTYSGTKDQFIKAGIFIDKLSHISAVDMENIIIVPGNHYVHRNDNSFLATSSRNQINNRDIVSKIIGNEKERATFLAGLNNYREFITQRFTWAKSIQNDPLSYTINRSINGTQVSVLALNSSWLANGNGNEKGELLIGERQVREALNQVDNPQVSISLMHHPFSWLKQFDEEDIKPILNRRTDFILNGHEHRTDMNTMFGKAFSISAGATYDSRESFNSYNIFVADLDLGEATVYLRTYTDRNCGCWISDNSYDPSIKDGMLHFSIQDRIINKDSLKSTAATSLNGNYKESIKIDNSKIEIIVPRIPQDLSEQIKNGQCILFAGAGTSLDAGLPSWVELLQDMIDEVDRFDPLSEAEKNELSRLMNNRELLVVAEYCKGKLGTAKYSDVIKKMLSIKNRRSTVHEALSKLPFHAAVTTNYDNFIESFHTNQRVILPDEIGKLCEHEVNKIFNDDCFPIFKIHGSCERAESIVLTDNDYRNVIFKQENYRDILKSIFKNKSLLFVGFSFSDLSVNLFLQEIFTLSNEKSIPHYALMSDAEVGPIKKDYFWKNINIKVITYPLIEGTHVMLPTILNNMVE